MLRPTQSLETEIRSVGFKDGFQTWNFLESFQLSDFNEMQSKVTWDFTYAFTRIFWLSKT